MKKISITNDQCHMHLKKIFNRVHTICPQKMNLEDDLEIFIQLYKRSKRPLAKTNMQKRLINLLNL